MSEGSRISLHKLYCQCGVYLDTLLNKLQNVAEIAYTPSILEKDRTSFNIDRLCKTATVLLFLVYNSIDGIYSATWTYIFSLNETNGAVKWRCFFNEMLKIYCLTIFYQFQNNMIFIDWANLNASTFVIIFLFPILPLSWVKGHVFDTTNFEIRFYVIFIYRYVVSNNIHTAISVLQGIN